jgi:thioredoxin reductase (NADPH)
MTNAGTHILEGITPTSIEKTNSGKLLVKYSSGESSEYDTVLAAVGRYADTVKLGLEVIGVKTNPKSGKIICENEQTSVPHVYAIGDVVEGAPELTPVAILAGKLLARRLFKSISRSNGGSVDEEEEPALMDYRNIATTVFTPLELGTVSSIYIYNIILYFSSLLYIKILHSVMIL